VHWSANPELYPPYLRNSIRAGKGVGVGSQYLPWLAVRDVPSDGTSAQIGGILIDRPFDLLAELEATYFFLQERKKSTVDIRECWPILDIDKTLELCSALGVRHAYRGHYPAPFTIDFLITESIDGQVHHRAASIKTAKDAADPEVRKRLGFLFGTIEGFQKAIRQASAQKSKCPGHANQIDAGVITEGIRDQHDHLLRDIRVSCRKVAQVLDVSVTTVVRRRRALGVAIAERRKHLNPAKLGKIAKAFARGQSPSSIASQYQVSLATVYRAGAGSPGVLNTRAELLQNREPLERRTRWVQTIKRHNNAGVTEIRAAASPTYAWLYRHDREWLREICKPLQPVRPRRHRVDWAARDIELCRRLARLARDLRLNPGRPRISKSLLLRLMGEAMIRVNLVRLPRLKALLNSLVESEQSFQIFRIERAISQLVARGLPLPLWRIQRLAGIRQWTNSLRIHARHLISQTEAVRPLGDNSPSG
jgi:hypothetical protein